MKRFFAWGFILPGALNSFIAIAHAKMKFLSQEDLTRSDRIVESFTGMCVLTLLVSLPLWWWNTWRQA